MKASIATTALGAAILSVSLAGAAQADPFAWGISDDTQINVGPSIINAGPHKSGLAGIGIETDSMEKDQTVDIRFLASFATVSETLHYGAVTRQADLAGPGPAPDHNSMGYFTFVGLGDISDDIWFGEWSRTGPGAFADRSVFYVGDKNGVSMPSSGTATYNVNGLNHFATSGDELHGQLTADFGAGNLSGSFQNDVLGIGIDASIAGSAFNGNAMAYDPANSDAILSLGGTTRGDFFGNQAEFLAGLATFSNSAYDTSFGGQRGAITP